MKVTMSSNSEGFSTTTPAPKPLGITLNSGRVLPEPDAVQKEFSSFQVEFGGTGYYDEVTRHVYMSNSDMKTRHKTYGKVKARKDG